MDPISRSNHDFEVLFKQQQSLQKISAYRDFQLLQTRRNVEDKTYSNTSLFCITLINPIRRFLIRTVLTKYFDYVILVVIIANCVIITTAEIMPLPWQDTADLIFLSIYTIESALKIVCMGFCIGKYSYLQDPWNVLDFAVVLSGWIVTFLNSSSINIVRTIRILRPVRTFNSVPEMKTLIISIFRALPLLFDIFLVFIFCLFVFSLIGIQIYGGTFTQRCYTSAGILTEKLCSIDKSCNEYEINCFNTGCDLNEYCWDSHINPDQGCTSFDNLLSSLSTIFIAVTMEGWSDVMRIGRQTSGQTFFSDVYFISLIIIVSFFMIKLTVAAIYVKFIQTHGELVVVHKEISIWESNHDEPFVGKNSWYYKWYLIRMQCYKVISHWAFEWGVIFLIIVNTSVIASEYYGMENGHLRTINYTNITVTLCFTLEMAMKVLGLGLKSYLSHAFNILDGLLVLIGHFEIVSFIQNQTINNLSILRAPRILRIFRIAYKWQELRIVLEKLLHSTKSICYLGLITFITIFIYALLGKRLFEGTLDDGNGNLPRANFDNFFWSFVTVFNLVTGENWNLIFYNTVGPNGWEYSLYFISLIIICGYILLNLFIAVLLEQFDENIHILQEDNSIDLEKTIRHKERKMSMLESKRNDIKRRAKIKFKLAEVKVKSSEICPLQGKSYLIFSPTNPIRKFLRNLMLHPYFDSFIYSLILMSCACLVLDEPNKPEFTSRFLQFYLLFSFSLFVCEFLVKSIVLGFIWGKNTYLRSVWNVVDLTIIFFSIIDQVLSSSSLAFAFIKAFRAIRALRPLRMISHNENMRKVVSSVFASIPSVFNVMCVTLLFYVIFGIVGVIFFKGIMYSCTDPFINLESECFGNFIYADGKVGTRMWVTVPYNFDNIFQAILTLFSISTLEAWPTYMYAAVDGVAAGISQKRDYNQYAALYYISFIFLTDFFIMNLYLGAVVKKFNEIQEEIDGSFFLSSGQKEWVKTQKLLVSCSPKIRYLPPKNLLRNFFFNLVLDYKFEYFIQSVIILNIIFMSLMNYPLEKGLENFLVTSNIVFLAIFAFEFVAKFCGLGFKYYFASKWNQFDFLILVSSLVSLSQYVGCSNTLILRVLRVSRLFRILKIFKTFQMILKTLVISFPSLLNVGAVLCLLWFVYGIAGTYLFSGIDVTNAQILSSEINFQTFYNSFMVLFQSITGENWNLIMLDCMGYYCDSDATQCGNPISAVIFWITYTILGQYFFLNLFIAVILENFITNQSDVLVAGLTDGDLNRFRQAWSVYAPYGELYVHTKCVPDILQILESPLGFKCQNLKKNQMMRIIMALGIVDDQEKVHFAELLWKLAHAVAGADMSTAAPCEALRSIQKILPKRLSITEENQKNKNLAAKTLAAYVITNKWRQYRRQKVVKS